MGDRARRFSLVAALGALVTAPPVARAAITFPEALDAASLSAWLGQETDLRPEQVVALSRSSIAAIVAGPDPRGDYQQVTVRAEAIDPRLGEDDDPVLSTQLQVMVDCPGHRARQGATAAHQQRNATGAGWIIAPQDPDWQEPSFGTQLENVWRAVCDPSFQRPLLARAAAAAPPQPGPVASRAPQPRKAPAPRRADPRLRVQVGAYPTMTEAQAARARIGPRLRQLEGRSADVTEAVVGDKRVYRLLVSGFASPEDEAAFCARYKAAGRECFLRNAPRTR